MSLNTRGGTANAATTHAPHGGTGRAGTPAPTSRKTNLNTDSRTWFAARLALPRNPASRESAACERGGGIDKGAAAPAGKQTDSQMDRLRSRDRETHLRQPRQPQQVPQAARQVEADGPRGHDFARHGAAQQPQQRRQDDKQHVPGRLQQETTCGDSEHRSRRRRRFTGRGCCHTILASSPAKVSTVAERRWNRTWSHDPQSTTHTRTHTHSHTHACTTMTVSPKQLVGTQRNTAKREHVCVDTLRTHGSASNTASTQTKPPVIHLKHTRKAATARV